MSTPQTSSCHTKPNENDDKESHSGDSLASSSFFNSLFSSEAIATQSSILDASKRAELTPESSSQSSALFQEIQQKFLALLQESQSFDAATRSDLLDWLMMQTHRFKQRSCSEAPPLPHRDYPKYPEHSAIDPYNWLEQHWGRWLKHFSPKLKRDHLFLDQLGELDPALKKALYAKRRKILSETGKKISEIVPKKSVRLDQQIAEANPEVLKAALRTYTLPRMRKHKP